MLSASSCKRDRLDLCFTYMGAIKMINTLGNHALEISGLFLKCRVLAPSALLTASFSVMSAKKTV